jgi:choline/glycine/proline betaine transport protein
MSKRTSTIVTVPSKEKRRLSVERWVFWPAAVIVLSFSAFALVAPHLAEVAFGAIQSSIVNAFNWYYVLIAAFFVLRAVHGIQ